MTHSTIELRASPEDRRIASLATAAIVLTLAEAAIPSPIPGIKPGLANIVTLIVLYQYGWRTAAWVAILRIIVGALALGQFLTPAFVLSLSGGLASLFMLAATVHLPRRWFGPVGVSIIAAFAHVATQLGVVNLWLMPGSNLMTLLPIFLSAAWLTGLVNGLACMYLLQYGASTSATSTQTPTPTQSPSQTP